MRRNNTFRIILIAAAIAWSLFQLYPTFMATRLKNQSEVLQKDVAQLSGLREDEINHALSQGLLEQRIREKLQSNSDVLTTALTKTKALTEIDDQVTNYESRAIQRGLDLQGGSYLVYEVDLPKLARELAKNKDVRFEELLRAVEVKGAQPNVDFLEVMRQHFAANQVRLSRYWGNRSQTDAQIVDDIRKNAMDAVDRNLEILRNRIDQFGVSEPSITKQGDLRVVIELAGITDVGRAKNIIGKTARLEFKLVKDSEVVNDVITKINNVMKKDLAATRGDSLLTTVPPDSTLLTAADSAKVRSDKEVSVDELFPGSTVGSESGSDSTGKDSTVLVDQEVFKENPFSSLLGALGPDLGVPAKNYRAVERILNNPVVQEVIPKDAMFAWSNKTERIADNEYYRLYLVKKDADLTGTYLVNADAAIGGSNIGPQGEWQVNMEFNSEGARIFSIITGANVNKRLAILLDDKIVTAPNINERIPSGRAVIHGSMNADEAQDLAIVLRAGALQAPMHVIEERTVGPSLGRDSIAKGQTSAIIGLVLVALFMAIYYRLSGVIANLALLLNLALTMAVLALLQATLTLPGVAGLILTIGMAVDANVLIFERIREELRAGKTVNAAIDQGYKRAFWTIFDANISNLLTALVLYQFGTGPIRGFAVTLSIGILASMFTAIVATRVVFDWMTSRRKLATLSI
ncbi:MAG: protein translocase subunit SecD [bacterium]